MQLQVGWAKVVIGVSLLMGLSFNAYAGYEKDLSGARLVIEDAVCAGLEFSTDSQYAKWRNEYECQMNDDSASLWRVIWIDNDDFALIQMQRNDDTSPPQTMLYKVESISGKTVRMTDYWTGWGDSESYSETFIIHR